MDGEAKRDLRFSAAAGAILAIAALTVMGGWIFRSEQIVAAMRPEFVREGHTVSVSTSVGIAFYQGEEAVAADDLVRKADQALYQAKAAGRDRYRVAA